MDEEEKQRLNRLLDNNSLAEKVSVHSSGFGFGLTISNILAKKILFQREENAQNALEEDLPGIHFTSQKNVGSDFRFYINTMDGESIVAKYLNTEGDKTTKSNPQKGRFSKIKVRKLYNEKQLTLFVSRLKTTSILKWKTRYRFKKRMISI